MQLSLIDGGKSFLNGIILMKLGRNFNWKACCHKEFILLNVKATGADGKKFHIKKDVNLLRGYNETTTQTH